MRTKPRKPRIGYTLRAGARSGSYSHLTLTLWHVSPINAAEELAHHVGTALEADYGDRARTVKQANTDQGLCPFANPVGALGYLDHGSEPFARILWQDDNTSPDEPDNGRGRWYGSRIDAAQLSERAMADLLKLARAVESHDPTPTEYLDALHGIGAVPITHLDRYYMAVLDRRFSRADALRADDATAEGEAAA